METIKFIVPEHFIITLWYGETDHLTEEEEKEIFDWDNSNRKEFNKLAYCETSDAFFSSYNDVNKLGATCVEVTAVYKKI